MLLSFGPILDTLALLAHTGSQKDSREAPSQPLAPTSYSQLADTMWYVRPSTPPPLLRPLQALFQLGRPFMLPLECRGSSKTEAIGMHDANSGGFLTVEFLATSTTWWRRTASTFSTHSLTVSTPEPAPENAPPRPPLEGHTSNHHNHLGRRNRKLTATMLQVLHALNTVDMTLPV